MSAPAMLAVDAEAAPVAIPMAAPVDRADERLRFAAGAVALVVLIAGLAAVTATPVGGFQDDAMYVVLARALATGEGYRFINLPGSPAATHFPPGYPAFLALLSFVAPNFPKSVVAFKIANAVLLAIAAGAGVLLAGRRMRLPLPLAVCASLLGALALPSLLLSGMVLSETLLLALAIPALLFAERVVADEPPSTRALLLLGAMGGGLALVRSVGLALTVGVLLALLVRRRARHAGLVLAGTAAALLPWQLWVATHADEMPALLVGKYGSYGGWLSGAGGIGALPGVVASSVTRNAAELAGMLGTLFSPVASMPTRLLATLVVLGAIASGARVLARRAPATLGFLAAYVGVVLAWPFNPTRFAWGIWLPLTLVIAAGAHAAWDALRRPEAAEPARDARDARDARGMARLAVAGLALFVAAGIVRYSAFGYSRGWHTAIQRSGAEAATPVVRWARAHGDGSALLATDDELVVYLYAGRRAVPVGTTSVDEHVSAERAGANAGAATMRAMIDAFPVRWVLVRSRPSAFAAESLYRATPPALVLVDTLPGGGAVFAPNRAALVPVPTPPVTTSAPPPAPRR